MMQDCGYTPEQVRAMEVPDFIRYCAYLKRRPSLRDLVEAIASAFGYEPPRPKTEYMTGEALKAFVDATGGKIEGISQYGG
jgi:ATP-dependent DNA ligase